MEGAAEAARAEAPPESLRENRDFRIWIVGQGVSSLGDAVSFTALPLLVVLLTGSGVQMGIVGVLQSLPDLLFGLPAGAVADRYDRRRLMLYADLGRGVLTALIPLSVLLGLPTMAVILLVTAPINLLRVLFLAAFTGAIPTMVGREQLGRANGYAEAVYSAGFVLGPAIAGGLVSAIGPAPTLALDAVSFVLSAASIMLIRRPLNAPADARPRRRLRTEMAEGVRFIWGHSLLRKLVTLASLVTIPGAPLVPAVIYFLTLDRGFDPGVVGFLITTYGVGYAVGSILVGRIARWRPGILLLGSAVANGAAVAGFAALGALPLMLVGSFFVGASWAVFIVTYITLRALSTPDELLSRVGSTARTISLGLQPVGFFTGGILLDALGGGPTLVVIGLVTVLGTGAFALSREVRTAGGPARSSAG